MFGPLAPLLEQLRAGAAGSSRAASASSSRSVVDAAELAFADILERRDDRRRHRGGRRGEMQQGLDRLRDQAAPAGEPHCARSGGGTGAARGRRRVRAVVAGGGRGGQVGAQQFAQPLAPAVRLPARCAPAAVRGIRPVECSPAAGGRVRRTWRGRRRARCRLLTQLRGADIPTAARRRPSACLERRAAFAAHQAVRILARRAGTGSAARAPRGLRAARSAARARPRRVRRDRRRRRTPPRSTRRKARLRCSGVVAVPSVATA